MKNKFCLIVLSLYIIILLLLSFETSFLAELNLSIVSLFIKEGNNYTLWNNILYYIELFIFYFSLSVIITIVCIEYFESLKYIIIYSILLNLLIMIISSLIKSYYITLDYYSILVIIISIVLGILFEFLIKISQVRREEHEE